MSKGPFPRDQYFFFLFPGSPSIRSGMILPHDFTYISIMNTGIKDFSMYLLAIGISLRNACSDPWIIHVCWAFWVLFLFWVLIFCQMSTLKAFSPTLLVALSLCWLFPLCCMVASWPRANSFLHYLFYCLPFEDFILKVFDYPYVWKCFLYVFFQ